MKYASIDIETTGLDPQQDQILEIGIIIDDGGPIETLPGLNLIIRRQRIIGHPIALAMNHKILERMDEGIQEENVFKVVSTFFNNNGLTGRVNVAGKNFGAFDFQFLKNLDIGFKGMFHHRFIDPAMFYLNEGDTEVPSLTECCARAGVPLEGLHDAVSDARTVIRLIRQHFNK
jgi:DNA polymerase III alpha subunit (gram-positive type)